MTPPGDSLSTGGTAAAGGDTVSAPPPGEVLTPSTGAIAAAEAVAGELIWTVSGQSAPKPSNDHYEKAEGKVWRKSEDRFRISDTADGLVAAVADGAGSSGMFCGAWAETLVERLPERPVGGLEALNQWIEGFWEDFSTEYKRRAQQDAGKLTKFVREGSYSTLAACWLGKRDGGISLNWLGYGDSPILVFDRDGGEAALSVCYPPTLEAMTRDPHLLNWKDLPRETHTHVGAVDLTKPSTVIVASDGIGQYVLLRYLAARHGGWGADGTGVSSAARELLGEFGQLLGSGNGNLARLARANSAAAGTGFAGELAGLKRNLDSAEDFQVMTRDLHARGLMPNDDATLIFIDIDYQSTADREGENDDVSDH